MPASGVNPPVTEVLPSIVIGPGYPAWLKAAVVAACLAAVVLAWLSLDRLSSVRRRIVLFVLRLAVIALIGCIALQPELELRRSARLRNTVAVVVDASESMGIRARREGPSRAEMARDFFRRNGDYFASLEKRMDVKYFSLAKDLSPTDRPALEKGVPSDGRRSNIVGGVRQAVESLRGERLRAVLLITDGADTEGSRAAHLRGVGAPVHVLFPREDEFKDVDIAEVRRDEFAFIRTPWEGAAVIRIRGYDDREIPVTLKEGNRILMSKVIATNAGQQNYLLDINLVPNRTGTFFYTLSVPRYADESVHRNNEFSFRLNVVRDKIRILQVCGMPSWDELFLRRALKLDPNVDLVSLFILRTPADLNIVPTEEMSLIPFPVNAFLRDDLLSIDVVIFQNFAYGPYGVAPYLPYIREYVKKERGAFVMIGGDLAFADGHYFATPIEDILPAEVPAPGVPSPSASFRARLTPEGKRHPITTLEPDDERNQAAWQRLPELDGYNKMGTVKPDAVVLADHPATGDPVIAVSKMGNGRTMAVAADTLWHWNFLSVAAGQGNRRYLAFWHNAVRWLIQDPTFDLVRIEARPDVCLTGEEVSVTTTVVDHTYKPVADAQVDYRLTKMGEAEPIRKGAARTDGRGEWRHQHAGDQRGLFTLHATASKDGRTIGEAEASFLVRSDDAEYLDPAVDAGFVAEAAGATGGRYYDLTDDRFLKDLPIDNPEVVRLLDRRSHPLWNNWAMLSAAALLLAVEWTLRRRMGLS
ncbi:MAG: glutamine amidotransferase [Planctomycetota bacterium]